MQALQVLLLHGLLGNEPHVRSRHCFADRFCIVGIVLLELYVRLDELRAINRTVCPRPLSTRAQ
jgi:hypothetical protein